MHSHLLVPEWQLHHEDHCSDSHPWDNHKMGKDVDTEPLQESLMNEGGDIFEMLEVGHSEHWEIQRQHNAS